MSSAIKLSAEFVELARGEGRVMGRSIAGQVEHWARLGRAVERAPGFAYARIHAALSAQTGIDELTPDEQGVALAELEEYLEQLPRDRDAPFFAKLRAAGAPVHGEPTRDRTRRATASRRTARKAARRRG